jgi:hypothetical protein
MSTSALVRRSEERAMASVALVIIYNHQFNANIELLEELYRERFPTIFHLMPFYRGERPNVIPVYESSFYFQGYVAQAARQLASAQVDHLLFVGDDLILNPKIDAGSYQHWLGLDPSSCFVPGFIKLEEVERWWSRCRDAMLFSSRQEGLEVEKQFPNATEARRRFRRHGLEPGALSYVSVTPTPRPVRSPRSLRQYVRYHALRVLKARSKYELEYPLVGSYSDIFAVSRAAFAEFAHYCGVFAALRMHVEIAVPTAMVLAADTIKTEETALLKGAALWTEEEMKILTPYGHSLAKLLADFPEGRMYLHPVKLSQWVKARGSAREQNKARQ